MLAAFATGVTGKQSSKICIDLQKEDLNMKIPQIAPSLLALAFASLGSFASNVLLLDNATANKNNGVCIIGTTLEDGCTLVWGTDLIRCTILTDEGVKGAYFFTTQAPGCTTSLWRQP